MTQIKFDTMGHSGESMMEFRMGREVEVDKNKILDNSAIGSIFIFLSWVIVVLTFPFSLIVCFKVVHEWERAVIFRLGRLQSGGSRGIFFVLPCIDHFVKVDLRSFCFDVPPQEILTKDSVTVSVDAVVYNHVSDAVLSIKNVQNAHMSTRLLAQTILRNILGTKNLNEILSHREIISSRMQNTLNAATDIWGIQVERVELKDVRLPLELQRVMAAEAEASREARAKIIAAEGEEKASWALKEASDIISQSPVTLQLRYLQTLQAMTTDKPSIMLFPVPIDMMKTMGTLDSIDDVERQAQNLLMTM